MRSDGVCTTAGDKRSAGTPAAGHMAGRKAMPQTQYRKGVLSPVVSVFRHLCRIREQAPAAQPEVCFSTVRTARTACTKNADFPEKVRAEKVSADGPALMKNTLQRLRRGPYCNCREHFYKGAHPCVRCAPSFPEHVRPGTSALQLPTASRSD